ncbi:MAG: sugar transferase [Synechococcus sp. SB0673_bin_10]|nr:sugar transferase [Synechococcus sp. SB0667_bin_8]MYF36692.1 sugar transferase [Synechococcus sp. SB0678_bin_12]MYI72399.1 sugar transferase [Synechococcus sp. SB0673_bin_10]MYI88042.1 sugar transferase [Synechococcus sp. SB0672_bin_10]
MEIRVRPHVDGQPRVHDRSWGPALRATPRWGAMVRRLLRSQRLKRLMDITVATLALVVGAPLFLMVALAVRRSSPGGLFYVQRRLGRGHKPFGCIKFRTMVQGADRQLRRTLKTSAQLQEDFRRGFKLKNDPRITPVGHMLRRTSLDELPQFLNILRGEMSLVGPRPIVRAEVERYGEAIDQVLSVRPGLTGLWQVSGRNNLTYAQRVALDLHYVSRRSFLLDLVILWRTVGVVLSPKDNGAY